MLIHFEYKFQVNILKVTFQSLSLIKRWVGVGQNERTWDEWWV